MIKLFDPYIPDEAAEAVKKVLKTGWIGQGPVTQEFEEKFADYVGSKYAVAVNSATSALHLAVRSLGFKEKSEVITTPLTFISTNHVLLYEGLYPVFADVEDTTLNIDLNKVEDLINKQTVAIMAVHYAGNPLNMDDLYSLANKYGLEVIEDAAHACGASYKGKKIGSFGLTCFSFQAVKNLPIGDGGMITTDDKRIYQKLRNLTWMGIDRTTFQRSKGGYKWEYDVNEIGFKYHINDIASAIGLTNLSFLDEWNTRRQVIVDMYKENLPDVKFIEYTPHAQSSNHLCVIRVPNRDEFYSNLNKADIEAGVHYKPNHLYPMYAYHRRGDLSVTEKAYREMMSLPLNIGLTNEDINYICQVIK
jgi:perosamine synthetase